MNENLFETEYKVTRKKKLKQLYEKNKIKIFLVLISVIVLLISLGIYSEIKKKERTKLSENYVEARIYLANGDKDKATKGQVVSGDYNTFVTYCLTEL